MILLVAVQSLPGINLTTSCLPMLVELDNYGSLAALEKPCSSDSAQPSPTLPFWGRFFERGH
jgi:hypothetical protein